MSKIDPEPPWTEAKCVQALLAMAPVKRELPQRVIDPRHLHVANPDEEETIRVSDADRPAAIARAIAHNRRIGCEPPSLIRERAARAARTARRKDRQ